MFLSEAAPPEILSYMRGGGGEQGGEEAASERRVGLSATATGGYAQDEP